MTVLVADDDPVALAYCCSALEQNDYQVLRATSTQEAIEVWSRNSEVIDLAFLDVSLPGTSGLAHLETALMSGGAVSLIPTGGGYRIFLKPFDLTIFLELIGGLHTKPNGP